MNFLSGPVTLCPPCEFPPPRPRETALWRTPVNPNREKASTGAVVPLSSGGAQATQARSSVGPGYGGRGPDGRAAGRLREFHRYAACAQLAAHRFKLIRLPPPPSSVMLPCRLPGHGRDDLRHGALRNVPPFDHCGSQPATKTSPPSPADALMMTDLGREFLFSPRFEDHSRHASLLLLFFSLRYPP